MFQLPAMPSLPALQPLDTSYFSKLLSRQFREMRIFTRDFKKQQQEMAKQNAEMQASLFASIPKPAPPPPAPPTMSKLEVQEAARQQQTDASKRKGLRKTILAGETGGYASSATGTRSILG